MPCHTILRVSCWHVSTTLAPGLEHDTVPPPGEPTGPLMHLPNLPEPTGPLIHLPNLPSLIVVKVETNAKLVKISMAAKSLDYKKKKKGKKSLPPVENDLFKYHKQNLVSNFWFLESASFLSRL